MTKNENEDFAQEKRLTTWGLAKACDVLASPLNKNIFVVRLGRKCHYDLTAFAKP
jgi:hypothetical protein